VLLGNDTGKGPENHPHEDTAEIRRIIKDTLQQEEAVLRDEIEKSRAHLEITAEQIMDIVRGIDSQ